MRPFISRTIRGCASTALAHSLCMARPTPLLLLLEALVGQAALEKRTLEISPAKREALQVSTGVGSIAAGQVLFVPVLNHDLLIGVIEFATVSALTERQQTLLDALVPSVAMNAQLLSRNLET